jgi:hypothetical protein
MQIFASGEAKICHQVANQMLIKVVIPRPDGAGLRNCFWSACAQKNLETFLLHFTEKKECLIVSSR